MSTVPISLFALTTIAPLRKYLLGLSPTQRPQLIIVADVWAESLSDLGIALRTMGSACPCCVAGPAFRTMLIGGLRQLQTYSNEAALEPALWVVADNQAELAALADAVLTPTLRAHVRLVDLGVSALKQAEGNSANDRDWRNQEAATLVLNDSQGIERCTTPAGWGLLSTLDPVTAWPSTQVFDRRALVSLLATHPLPVGIAAVLRTQRDWYWIQRSQISDLSKDSVFSHDWRPHQWRFESQLLGCSDTTDWDKKSINIKQLFDFFEGLKRSH